MAVRMSASALNEGSNEEEPWFFCMKSLILLNRKLGPFCYQLVCLLLVKLLRKGGGNIVLRGGTTLGSPLVFAIFSGVENGSSWLQICVHLFVQIVQIDHDDDDDI